MPRAASRQRSESPLQQTTVSVWLTAFALVLIVVCGGALRFFHPDWDSGMHLHPDERQITMVALNLHWPGAGSPLISTPTVSAPLDPKFFAYGSLPLYLLAGGGSVLHAIATHFISDPTRPPTTGLTSFFWNANSYEGLNLLGRVLSAAFDTGSIVICFLIGRRVYGLAAGLLAAALYAGSVLAIQQAHFYVVDPIMTFFILVSLFFCLRRAASDSLVDSVLAGLFFGLAMATKVSAAPLALALVVAHVRWRTVIDDRHPASALPRAERTLTVAGGALALTLLVAGVAFLISEPYAVLDWPQFSHDIIEQSSVARGGADYPYTRQYAHTTPYLYWLWGLVTWQLGPLLGVGGLVGLVWQLLRQIRRPRVEELYLLAWWLPYFAITGSFYAKFPRYMLPIVPFLCVAGAGLALTLLASQTAWKRWLVGAIAGVTVLTSALYSVAYDHIYAVTNTRVAATQWIYANIPTVVNGKTTVITHESWDDGLPLALTVADPTLTPGSYAYADLPIYDPDTPDKRATMVTDISSADYIIEASEIVRGSILRNPDRYPMTNAYYQALSNGSLGFKMVQSFTSDPTILGLRLNDQSADLNWLYYDHPPVTIYKKVRTVSADELTALMPLPGESATTTANANIPSLNLTPTQQAANAQSPTLGAMFPIDGIGMRWPLLIWLLTAELLGFIGLPWSVRLLRAMPDAGYSGAKVLGWLLAGWATWFLASTGVAWNDRNTMVAVVVVLVALAAVGWATLGPDRGLPRQLWRRWLLSEGVFLTAFAVFLLIRAFNPDLWNLYRGGEKPMELSYMHAILRSELLPPLDPWLSGTTINYYYFGLYLVSWLFRFTTIAPETGFNLAVPLIYGLAMQLAAVNGYALTRLIRRHGATSRSVEGATVAVVDGTDGASLSATTSAAWSGLTTRWAVLRQQLFLRETVVAARSLEREQAPLDRFALAGGAAAALLFGVLGNLDSGPYVLHLFRQSAERWVGGGIPVISGIVQTTVGAFEALITAGATVPDFNYFDRTRVIPNTINEFPFFSFLYADLHPHVIDMPFSMCAIAFVISLIAGSRRLDWRPMGLTTVVLGGFLIGATWPINLWDYPVYLLLAPAAVFVRTFDSSRWLRSLLLAIGFAAALFIVGRLAFWPFYQHFYALDTGIAITKYHSPIGPFLLVYGLLFFLLASYLIKEQALQFEGTLLVALPILALTLFFQAWSIGLLVGLLALTLRLAWIRRAETALLAPLLLAGMALCIVLGTELVFVKDPLQGGDYQRMNTVFKFGVQAWMLLAMATGPLAVRLLEWWRTSQAAIAPAGRNSAPVVEVLERVEAPLPVEAAKVQAAESSEAPKDLVAHPATVILQEDPDKASAPPFATSPDPVSSKSRRDARQVGRRFWLVSLAVLVACAAAFPLFAPGAKIRDRFETPAPTPSLDGMAFMRVSYPDDYAAIRWLQENVAGTPVLLEANNGLYSWFGRVSWFTGLPTVLGWDYHTSQFHGADIVQIRKEAVTLLYTTTSPAVTARLLAQYHVSLIYVGPLEQQQYAKSGGLVKFPAMVGSSLTLLYDAQGVQIYHVNGAP